MGKMENEFKTLKEYLMHLVSERKQTGIIYHFTRLKSIESILSSGNLGSHQNYISFTRNPLMVIPELYKNDFSYIKGEYNARIKINGTKLSDHYKIEPFFDEINLISRKQGENEERIKAKAVYILDCIEEIQVLQNKNIILELSMKFPDIKIISVQNFKGK